MIDTPQIVQADAQLTAVIRFNIPRADLATVMAPAITEVLEAVAAQGVGPGGPVFVHHLRMDPIMLDFEVGVPVTAPFASVGRVSMGQLPAASIARTMYYGAYDGLSDAWAWFGRWIAAARYTAAADLWECYVVGPESSKNPIYWRTELNRPLTNPPSDPHR
jgi:effector-binding domain-containing protein